MVWEINYLFDLDFSRATKPFRILVDRKPLTEIVIVELKTKHMETLIKTNNTKNYKLYFVIAFEDIYSGNKSAISSLKTNRYLQINATRL